MKDNIKGKGIKFDSKQALVEFLNSKVEKLNEEVEYNLMAHEVKYCAATNNGSLHEDLTIVLSSIFKHGFKLNNYLTIFGTMSLLGSSKEQDLGTEIANYSYYLNQKTKLICLLASPKYISIAGNTFEYSSFNGRSANNPDNELAMAYKKQGFAPDLHDYKSCLFDLIKPRIYLPKCYTLGGIVIDDKNQQYVYYDYDKHLSRQNKEFQTEHKKEIEKRSVSLFKKYQTQDLKEIIVEEYKKELPWIYHQLDFI